MDADQEQKIIDNIEDRIDDLAWLIIKMFLVLLVSLALFSFAIIHECHASDWLTEQKTIEIAWQALHVIDWGQTRNIAMDPQYEEVGLPRFVIGSHPDKSSVDLYMGATAIGHYLISDWLIDSHPKWVRWWQYVSLGATGGAVVHNFSIGLRCEF